jgi:corrinoid protein of di/trimethylamine methyltransferase
LKEAVIQADGDAAESAAKEALAASIDPVRAIDEGLAKGLREVGERFGRLELFLSDMMLSAEAMTRGVRILKTSISGKKGITTSGRIVIGTVKGDIHDIGKNIVSALLTANSYDVRDMGTDVPTCKFISEANHSNADVIGLSALLSTTMPAQAELVRRLVETGERQRFRVIVGGAPVSEEWARQIGADAYGKDAADAVVKLNALLHGQSV